MSRPASALAESSAVSGAVLAGMQIPHGGSGATCDMALDKHRGRKPVSLLSSAARVVFYVAGIYMCYLTWGVLQERISTMAYPRGIEPALISTPIFFPLSHLAACYNFCIQRLHGLCLHFAPAAESSDKFSSFIFLNCCQALASWAVSFSVSRYYQRASRSTNQISKDGSSSPILSAVSGPSLAPKESDRFPALDKKLFLLYLKISIIYSISSPFAYASLRYIHYVAMNLGKACKLLPLVLIKIFVKRESIERAKLVNLLLITVGVVGFLLFEAPRPSKRPLDFVAAQHYQDPIFRPGPLATGGFGMFLLLVNLFLDGLMNSMQDEVFSTYRVSPFHMMFNLNRNSTILMLSYLFLSPFASELTNALKFIAARPSILPDILLFSICGAVGQAIVFLTLGNFGAIFLVTITVTRKLFTILLSVLYFGHSLAMGQWLSVALVFLALVLEAATSASRKKHPLPPVELAPTPSGKYEATLLKELKKNQ